jgi:hypothetical protein
MQHRRLIARRTTFSALGILAAGLLSTSVFAQAQGGFGRGQGGNRPAGNRQGGRGMRQLNISDVPASALADGLKLTSDQVSKITAIQKPYMEQRKALMPKPGTQPDMQAMRDGWQKMQASRQQVETDVTAVLTDTQKEALPALLKQIGELQMAGIPAELYGTLGLTDDQKTQIVDASAKAQRKMREAMTTAQQDGGDPATMRATMQKLYQESQSSALSVLTPAQRQTVEAYRKDHPQMMRGGMGGGGRRGGQGGPGGPAGARPAGPNSGV